MSSYKNTPLYGGALVCELPANFADVRYDMESIALSRAARR